MSSHSEGGSSLHVHHEGTVTSIDISDREDVQKLRSSAIGLLLVLFLCVTGSAPLAVFMFNFPFVVGAGNEQYAPAAFFFATIVLTIFSVGYVQMARRIRAAGGMFTYVSHGLGRTLGIVSGFSLAAAYTLFGASLIGGFEIDITWLGIIGVLVPVAALAYALFLRTARPERFEHAGRFVNEGQL
jgi:amino acid transporter